VVTIPAPRAAGFYSKELCGGTHCSRVGDIGVLKIVSEESVVARVRRIERSPHWAWSTTSAGANPGNRWPSSST